MGNRLIAFECVASEHRPSREYPDKLTIHEDQWAFCAFDARADGHDWHATGGEPLDAVMRRVGLHIAPPPSTSDPAEVR